MLARLSLEQIKSILKRGIFEELVKVMYSMVYVILVLLIFTGCNGLENWMKEDINEALVITAGKGNTSAVRTLLKRGADVNTVSYSTYFGITALGSAAYEGHLDTVR